MTIDALAGAAISSAFSFLFDCLKDLLESKKEDASSQVETHPLSKDIGPLVPDPALLSQNRSKLVLIEELLEDYAADPSLIHEEDSQLVKMLIRLKDCLEEVYGIKDLPLDKLPPEDVFTYKSIVEAKNTEGPVSGSTLHRLNVDGQATITNRVTAEGTKKSSEVTGSTYGIVDVGRRKNE